MKEFIAVVLVIVVALFVVDVLEPSGYGLFGKVGAGKVAVVTRFGEIKDETLESGFHLKNFFDVFNQMSIRTQNTKMKLQAFSSDIQQVDTTVTVSYNVDKVAASVLFREVGKNYEDTLLTPRLQENTKIVFARYTAEDLVQERDQLSAGILSLMQEDLSMFGISVTAVAIEDIDFTDAFTNAVEAKQVATQERLTAQTQQERLTMEAEAEALRQTIAANAKAEVERIEADAEAYSIKTRADAEAEANQKIAATITEELIDYTQIQNWNGELPKTFIGNGETIPVIQTNAEE